MKTDNLFKIAGSIYRQTVENQGCTMNIRGESPVSGYMVGLNTRSLVINLLNLDEGHIDSFIRSNLGILFNKSNYVGTWCRDGVVYIDISINCPDLDSALTMAKVNKQLAIWSIEKAKEIQLH